MAKYEIKHYKVLSLPLKLEANVVYYVLDPVSKKVKTYITDLSGLPISLLDLSGGIITGTGVTGTVDSPIVDISTFVSSQLNNQIELSPIDGKLVVYKLTSPNNSININKTSTELQIQLSSVIVDQINNSLQAGDNISSLINDSGFITLLDIEQDKNFLYTQNTPNSVWNIVHTLNKFPSVSVKDSAGTTVFGQVDYINITTLTITFNSSFSGVAILN